ncbi:MAG: class I SAM-dependent methyltransferase [Chloroflexota bacterium]
MSDNSAGSIREIGSPAYLAAVRREAAFWEDVASGVVDLSVAAWRDSALSDATTGDLVKRALDLTVRRGPRVLELACGGGGISMLLAGRGCHCDGIDLSPGLIERGRRTAEERAAQEQWPGSVRLMTGDLNRIELEPEHYDVVLANAALHHVLDLDHLLNEVHAALKPGGTLICLDHMEPSRPGLLLRYALLLILPTEIPYHRKPLHVFNRLMARVYRRFLPKRPAPAAFTLPDHSPFEDVSGSEAGTVIRRLFTVETYRTYLAFADIVSGHLRLGSRRREAAMARRLRAIDDALIRGLGLRGQTYYLVARKPMQGS